MQWLLGRNNDNISKCHIPHGFEIYNRTEQDNPLRSQNLGHCIEKFEQPTPFSALSPRHE